MKNATDTLLPVGSDALVLPLHPREIAKCGCKNQEVKLHNPIMLERTANGQFWTWSDCCCHALHPETSLTKYSRTESAAIKFAKRFFGFRHNAERMDPPTHNSAPTEKP